jgi:nitroreductase
VAGDSGTVNDDGTAGAPSFFDVVFAQRACRSFTDEPVDEQLIELCLRAATHAPSAENRQPWVFVVVRKPEARAAIGAVMRRAWREGARQYSEDRLPAALLADVDRGAEGGIPSAPVLVVVCGDSALSLAATLPSSVFPATQNLLLAATALGLGSAMTTLATLYGDELAGLLDLPPTVVPLAVVPLGWPTRPLGAPRRLPVDRRAHRDRYGRAW